MSLSFGTTVFRDFSITLKVFELRECLFYFKEQGLKMHWEHASEKDAVLKVMDGDDQYRLRFIKDETVFRLDIESLPVFTKRMKKVMEHVMMTFKGTSWLYIEGEKRIYQSRYEQGKVKSYKELDKDYNVLDEVYYVVDQEKELYVVERLLDYRLMELNDLIAAKRYKGRAKDIRGKKEELEELRKEWLDIQGGMRSRS